MGGGGVVSQHALQDYRWYPSMPCSRFPGGWYPSVPCRFPAPLPRGKLRGLARGVSRPHQGRGGTRPTPREGVYPSMHWGRPSLDSHCCGRYASYWNAFLLQSYLHSLCNLANTMIFRRWLCGPLCVLTLSAFEVSSWYSGWPEWEKKIHYILHFWNCDYFVMKSWNWNIIINCYWCRYAYNYLQWQHLILSLAKKYRHRHNNCSLGLHNLSQCLTWMGLKWLAD